MDCLLTRCNPDWLSIPIPSEYEKENLLEILLFFVIYSPCKSQSCRAIELSDRGWKESPWHVPSYLKSKLDTAIFGADIPRMHKVDSKEKMSWLVKDFDLDENFYQRLHQQRALFVKSSAKQCDNLYMSFFYHIRNALAHGRFALYPISGDDVVFVMEDGKRIGSEDDRFEVNARIVIKQSSLLEIIKLLKSPPEEHDYESAFLMAIEQGHNTKQAIMQALSISDNNVYTLTIGKLKLKGLVVYHGKKWVLTENTAK